MSTPVRSLLLARLWFASLHLALLPGGGVLHSSSREHLRKVMDRHRQHVFIGCVPADAITGEAWARRLKVELDALPGRWAAVLCWAAVDAWNETPGERWKLVAEAATRLAEYLETEPDDARLADELSRRMRIWLAETVAQPVYNAQAVQRQTV